MKSANGLPRLSIPTSHVAADIPRELAHAHSAMRGRDAGKWAILHYGDDHSISRNAHLNEKVVWGSLMKSTWS